MRHVRPLVTRPSLLCLWQPQIVCCNVSWSSHMKTKVILLLCQTFLIPATLTSMLTPEIWFMFCFYSTFCQWTSPRIDFLKYHNMAPASVFLRKVEVTSIRKTKTLAFQNKSLLIWQLFPKLNLRHIYIECHFIPVSWSLGLKYELYH